MEKVGPVQSGCDLGEKGIQMTYVSDLGDKWPSTKNRNMQARATDHFGRGGGGGRGGKKVRKGMKI